MFEDYTGNLRGNTYDPYSNPAANQLIDGIPRHTEWDVYAERHNPVNFGIFITPDTMDAHGGEAETNFTETLAFRNPQSIIVWTEEQNYQGIAPMELQPLLEMPNPWEQ